MCANKIQQQIDASKEVFIDEQVAQLIKESNELTIETQLKRIADALESIAKYGIGIKR